MTNPPTTAGRSLETQWINEFLHVNLTAEEMKAILAKLGCGFEGDVILIPTYRPDLTHKADIAEEIARFYGYNNIPSTSIKGGAQGKYTPRQKFEAAITNTMLAMGLNEIMTYSFISPKYYDKIGMPADSSLRKSVTISNPLGEDTSVMRTVALPSMMEALARNYNNRNEEVALFELASEYIPTTDNQLPVEKTTLIGGMYGKKADFFVAKGMVDQLLSTLSVFDYEYEASAEEFSYHPGRCAVLKIGDTRIGVLGQIHPTVAENYGIEETVVSFSLDVDQLFQHAAPEKTYTPLPKFPAVTRDLALLCQEDIPVRKLEKAIETGGGRLLESIQLFDVYQGEQIEAGKKSVAFRLVLRSNDSTLTDEQANSTMKKIMKELEKIGAILRT